MIVFAHGIEGRADLPIPAAWFAAGAALVLVLSFAALAAGWTRPRLQKRRERPLARIPFGVEAVLGLGGVAAFVVTVYAGLTGTDVPQDNLAPTVIYVLLWVGIPIVSLLFGDVFRLLSPWRAIGRAGGTLMRRLGGPELSEPLPYPQRLGRWPAAAALLVFAVVELCWGRGDDPQTLAVLAVGYLLVQIVGMSLYGVETWTRNGDAFGVYFGLFARMAPLGRRDDGTLVLRAPALAATDLRTPPGTVALLVVGIAATTFDGAREGPLFNGLAGDLQTAFVEAGLSRAAGLELAFLLGLLGSVALVAAIFLAGARRRARDLAHTLIPILAAYVVAHYASLLVFQGQAAYALASDPLGEGADLFGTADARIDYTVLSVTGVWYLQLVALLAGHLAALALAHDRVLARSGSARAATGSQIVMLVVMVAFTCLGLWQLSVENSP